MSIVTKLSANDDPKLNVSLCLRFTDKTADSSWENTCLGCHWSSGLKDLVTNYYTDMSTSGMVEYNSLNKFCYKDVR